MSWTTAVSDVRTIISDGPTDKLYYRKAILGKIDGTNKVFKTFEFRRITDFTSGTAPLGVYVDNAAVTVASDDVATGEVTLTSAPAVNSDVVATYYAQWFIDTEIEQFLTIATQWIGLGTDYTQIGDDLQPAAKEYAAATAFQKLSNRFATNLAETYQLYDSPDEKRFNPVTQFMSIAKQKFDLAQKLRDDVYTRKGQALAPKSSVISGQVSRVAPNR